MRNSLTDGVCASLKGFTHGQSQRVCDPEVLQVETVTVSTDDDDQNHIHQNHTHIQTHGYYEHYLLKMIHRHTLNDLHWSAQNHTRV